MTRVRSYSVSWEIDIDEATDPVDAARQALDAIMGEGSIAHVFEVLEDGRPDIESVTVDLDAIDRVHGCSCGEADYGAPGHDGGPPLAEA